MFADTSELELPELLASIDESALRAATLVSQLSGGPVSRTWQLDSAMGPVVLRQDLPLAAKLQLDRETEMVVLSDAAQADIGPELLWADSERGLLVTRLLPGRVWQAEDVVQPENLIRLGRLFSRLHVTAVRCGPRDVRSTLEMYAELLNTAKARSILLNARRLFAELSIDSARFVLCHGDVHSSNIVDNGALRLIDWEYAGAADPCQDLAVVAQQHRLSADQVEYLLAGYAESQLPVDRARLRQFCRIYDCLATLWYMLARSEPLQAGWSLVVPTHYQD